MLRPETFGMILVYGTHIYGTHLGTLCKFQWTAFTALHYFHLLY